MSLVQPIRLRVLPKLIPLDGKSVEMRSTDTAVQWRMVGDQAWINLIPLSDITGEQVPAGPPGTTDYDDLSNKPTLGTAAATDASDYATAAEGALAGTALQPADIGVSVGDVLAANNGSDFASAPDVRKNLTTPVYVADRTAAKALDATKDAVLTITNEGRRNGTFAFVAVDLSARVAIDPLEGVYIPPASDPTGASGAWVRQSDWFASGVSSTWFDLRADGTTDDIASLRAAANFMSAFGGGKVLLPAGKIVLKDQLVLGTNVWLEGAGWSTYAADDAGTILIHDFSELESEPDAAIKVTGAGGGLSNVEQRTAQPTPDTGWEPALQSTWAIKIWRTAYIAGSRHFKIQNVMQRAWSRGVFARSEQVEIKGLYGQWFNVGVEMSGVYDVSRIDILHHWAFFSADPNVLAYQNANCRIIRSGRNDNPQWSNIFGWNMLAGIEFFTDDDATPTGRTARATLTNFGFDFCKYGILTDSHKATIAPGHNVSLSNGSIYCDASVDSIGVLSQSDYDLITLETVRITRCGRHAVSATGTNSKVFFNSGIVDTWNQLNNNYPMIVGGAASNNYVYLGPDVYYATDGSTSNNGPITNGYVRGVIRGNVLATKEILVTGTLDGSGNAYVSLVGFTNQLHSRLLVLQGFAIDGSGYPDQLDKTQISVADVSAININAGATYANRNYRVYVKVAPTS